jgi:CubicO group peptidase (beta-lactamase class C family)
MNRVAHLKSVSLVRNLATMTALSVVLSGPTGAQPNPNSPRAKAGRLIEALLTGGDDVAGFVDEHFVPKLASGDSKARTIAQLEELRNTLRDGELADMFPIGPLAVQMDWDMPDGTVFEITFELTRDEPHKFMTFDAKPAESAQSTNPIELTWATLDEWMVVEAKNGFTGAVIIVRDGETVLEKGFGWANFEKKIRNTANTVFAIGSTPIDFTKASILQLYEQGRLDLSDPITRYFDDVPEDKRAITLDHLMSGRSGLQDFHDLPGDANPDHTWIDRDEAMRRIFAQTLRFTPGKGRAHSHSAFGVLAAVIEIVSGQSYEDYTREHLFEPAGMTSTGFFGEPIPEERLAVGRGMRSSGVINAPPYWGRTSWLVMGSGGQVATVGDMARWIEALHAGKIIDGQNLRRIVGPRGEAFGVGGNMFGFQIHYSMAPDNLMVIISNVIDSRERRKGMEAMSRQLRGLFPPRGNAYSVGIGLDADEHGPLVSLVVPGSAAQRDGLEVGDRLLAVAGKSMQKHDPIEVLDELLQSGAPIVFEIERGGQKKSVRVTPTKR